MATMDVPVPSCSPWYPEDDLLLKSSIEAGASLEALAKGAVKFSRRFTISEIRNRWHSLLYDPEVSARASVRMIELELSGSSFSSKNSRLDNLKGNDKSPEKRKFKSIRTQYYAMRKRIKAEFLNSTDLGVLDEPSLQIVVPGQSAMLDDCLANNLGFEETDFEILRLAFPETVGDVGITAAADSVANSLHSKRAHNSVQDDFAHRSVKNDSFYKYPENFTPVIRNDVSNSLEPSIVLREEPNVCKEDSNNYANRTCIGEVGPSQTQLNGNHFENDESLIKHVSNSDSINDNRQVLCPGLGGKQHLNSPGSDGSASFHTMGFSPVPRMPLWRTMEDVCAPDMPVSESKGARTQDAEEVLAVPENIDQRGTSPSGYDGTHTHSLSDKHDGVDFINSNAVLEGDFIDLPDSLLNFSNEDELVFMDVDGKGTTESKPNSQLLLPSHKEVLGGNLCVVEPKKNLGIENSSFSVANAPCSAELRDTDASVRDNERSVCHVDVNVRSMPVSNPKTVSISEGSIVCTLNTEDLEIPCNDDIFLLIHPSASFYQSVRHPSSTDSIDLVFSSADEKDDELGLNYEKREKDPASPFKRSQIVGRNLLPTPISVEPPDAFRSKSELSNFKSPVLLPMHPRQSNKVLQNCSQSKYIQVMPATIADGVLEKDGTQVEFRAADSKGTCGQMPLHAEENLGETIAQESIVNPSTSDQDECESDGGIPYFSDIEAMILDMDLAHARDSCIFQQVSRYQHEDTTRTIIRLEQTADSSLRRAMTSQGALAILYGRHFNYYIKKTEVIIGRSTDDTDVDIDLRNEGRANKISRRQATIKMETDGSFCLKNIGKSSISVNGKAITCGQVVALTSSCLIEIRGMCLLFEINKKYVKRYMDNLTERSQSRNRRTCQQSAKADQ